MNLADRNISTVNGEIFTGLNFCGIHGIWIFMVILS